MKKNIVLIDESLIDEYLAIMCIGLINCYEQKVFDYEKIMLWLFNNGIISFLIKNNSDQSIVSAIEYGEELWGIENTDLYEITIFKIKDFCIEFLKNCKTNKFGKAYLSLD